MGSTAQFNDVCLKLDVSIYGQITKLTETLSKCRVRIFYKGMNRNRTYISDDFANQLISSLPYAPIKGIFSYTDVDYEDHGQDNTDGRVYGIIPENPNFAWEKHLDDDGIEREYATADVILFTGLYPEANLIPGKSQSMEIFKDTMDGEWRIYEDGKPYFYFKSGGLLGLQILGEKVEPCFEGSAFFSLFKELQGCYEYIKKQENKEVNNIMDKTLFRLSDNDKAIMIEDALNPNYNEAGDWQLDYCVIDTYDEYALCRDRKKQKFVRVYYTKDDINNTISINGEPEEVFIVDVTQSEYTALLALQAVGGTYEKINNDYTESQTKISDLEKEKANFEAEKTNLEIEINELKAEKSAFDTTIAEKDASIQKYENQISELNAEKVRLEAERNNIISENTSLEAFKRSVENEKKTAIIDEFSAYLTDEQIDTYKSNMGDYSVTDFKKEICTAAYDADPSIFSNKESGLIYTGDTSDGKAETGVIRILNKYKNGGNK